MSNKHIKKIQKVFAHPVATDLDILQLASALEHFGCVVEHSKNSKLKLSCNSKEIVIIIHHAGSLSKDEVVKLRHYLEEVGITPDKIA